MRRREFLLNLSTLVPAAALAAWPHRASAAVPAVPPGWRVFEVVTSVDLAATSGPTQVWLPLPLGTPTSYQRLLSTSWDAPGSTHAELAAVPGYDVRLLHVHWRKAAAVRPVTLSCKVATRDRRASLDGASATGNAERESAEALERYLRPTALLPTDGIVRATAQRICAREHGDTERAHALYEWVVKNTTRDPKTPGCGMGDVASMLRSGYLGGKCADINALFVALARSVGLPARDAYGVRVADSRLGYQCLGKSGDVSKAQHCRAEFYARNQGWIPVDPADVRKVMLEERPGGLPLSDPKVQAARQALFGSWEMNWLAYNHGHDVALPGSTHAAIPFLMYPNGESGGERLNSLDPTTFRYAIHSRELYS
jgi:transglutaminase-like putative cysteine protease